MESGLVVTVQELEPLIDRWRLATVESAAAGGPAHVTALYPWLDAPVSDEQLAELAGRLQECPPVSLTFDRVDRFPKGVLFLSLDDRSEREMRRLTRLLTDAYPECPPYGGEHPDPHPHLTVACGTPDQLDVIEPGVSGALGDSLPFTTIATEVVVMELHRDGRWVQAHRLPLRSNIAP